MAGPGKACRGVVLRGMARRGRHGVAGMVLQGEAWQDGYRLGKAGLVGRGADWHGMAWHGRHGSARLGGAGYGTAGTVFSFLTSRSLK